MQRYQEGLKERMRGTEIVFHSVYLLHHNFHKANSDYIWKKIIYRFSWMAKKATINPKNNDDKDDKYFQYALTVALNYQNKKQSR